MQLFVPSLLVTLTISVIWFFMYTVQASFSITNEESMDQQLVNISKTFVANNKIFDILGSDSFSIKYPSNWNYTLGNNYVDFTPQVRKVDSNESLYVPTTVEIIVWPNSTLTLEEAASEVIKDLHNLNLIDNLNFVHFKNSTLDNSPAYESVYTYRYTNESEFSTRETYKEMTVTTQIGGRLIDFRYWAQEPEYNKYLDVMNEMRSSLSIKANSSKVTLVPGLKIPGNIPTGLSLSEGNDSLYVTNFGSNSISIIDLKTSKVKNIDVGTRPEDITSPIDGIVFVANIGSNSVSAIDTVTNKIIASIPVQMEPIRIVADTNLNDRLVFVANQDSSSISIINGDSSTLNKNIPLMHSPIAITVNPLMNRVYTANSDGTISVLDYFEDPLIPESIKIADDLYDITVEPLNNILFATSESEGLYILNGSTYETIDQVDLEFSREIDIDPLSSIVFITTQAGKGIYAYDYKNNKSDTISLGYEPANIEVDSNNQRIFVSGGRTNQIHAINETSKNLMVGITFGINGTQGMMNCNGNKIVNNTFSFYDLNNQVKCTAYPNNGFSFGSWSGSLLSGSMNDEDSIILNMTKYGTISANFVAIDPLISLFVQQSQDLIYTVITSMIVTPIIGWLIYSYLNRIEKRRQLKYLNIYLQLIDQLFNKYHDDKVECIKTLEDKRYDIISLLKEGVINESTYGILIGRIEKYITTVER